MSGRRPTWQLTAALCVIIACGAAVGGAVARRPFAAVAASLLFGFACYAIVLRRDLPRVFLGAMGIALLGYAVFGRSFAYIGAAPVFIGEAMLGFGLVAAVGSGALSVVARSTVSRLLIALAVCGAAATLPYLDTYGMDALRDAALWGYGVFTFTVAACVIGTDSVASIARNYGRLLLLFAAWPPLATLMSRTMPDAWLLRPGTGLPLFLLKPGDVGVHLAGAAAFVLVGLDREFLRDGEEPRPRRAFWLVWAASFLIVSALNRGGFLAVMTTFAALSLLEPAAIGKRLSKYIVVLVVAGVAVLATSLGLETKLVRAGDTTERALSPRQVVENVMSITGRDSAGDLSNTREWRLDWWQKIIDYTVFGEYFWTGKGFGVNLADDDGFQVAQADEAPLRSPHSSFMTLLARMGVPGVCLWLALLIGFGGSMVRGFLAARRAGASHWAKLNLWILGYWLAFLVNACFDVFLEGPQGGIWFWCVIGLGVAVRTLQRIDLGRAVPQGTHP